MGKIQPDTITFLTSDEWDHIRYLISCESELLDAKVFDPSGTDMIDGLLHNNILTRLEREVKGRSIKANLKDPDVESALRVLESIDQIKKELTDNKTIMLFLKSFVLLTDVYRAGCMTRLSMKKNSEDSKNIKRLLVGRVIIDIFEKYPNIPRTLGMVWNKIDLVAKGKPITDKRTGKMYYVKTGKNKKGEDILLITGDGIKPTKPLEYSKRSLYKIIDHLRKQYPSKITQ